MQKTPCERVCAGRLAFTLVELLVVMAIIGMLLALLFPAVHAAREAGRQMTCKSNLREFGIGLLQRADKFGTFCSGAFDWKSDGVVTDVGWVADLVNQGVPTGKMLCPSNPAQIAATYNDLLNADTTAFDACVSHVGSTAGNPCQLLVSGSATYTPGSPARTKLVQTSIYGGWYNTNYTASWWLVRSGVQVNSSGNLVNSTTGCAASLTALGSTLGPLSRARLDNGAASVSFVPLLGCGGKTVPLSVTFGSIPMNAPAVASMTAGPVQNPSMQAPTFTEPTDSSVWIPAWQATIQDFRAFGVVHRGACNLLMADGSVQTYFDTNGDHLLNNGFTPSATQNDFTGSTVELPPNEVYSSWSLRP